MGYVIGAALSTIAFIVLAANTDLTPLLWTLVLLGAATGAAAWTATTASTLADPSTARRHGVANAVRHRDGVLLPYFHTAVFSDLRVHWSACNDTVRPLATPLTAAPPPLYLALWPITVAAALWFAAAAAAIYGAALLLTAVASALTGLWRLLWLTGTPLLRAVHDRWTTRLGGRVTCSRPDCLRSCRRPRFRDARTAAAEHGIDRYPSSAGVIWSRDRLGHRHLTLPFRDASAIALCPHCLRTLWPGAGRERQVLVLVTGTSTEASAESVRGGFRQFLESETASGDAALATALRPAGRALTPGREPAALPMFQVTPGGPSRPVSVLCAPVGTEYLDGSHTGPDLPLFDDCQAVAFVVGADNGWAEARQRFNVLRQRLALHREDARRIRLAVVARHSEPRGEQWSAIQAILATDFPQHRLFSGDRADTADPWRWLTGIERPQRIMEVRLP